MSLKVPHGWFCLGWPGGHLLGNSWPHGFPHLLFYFMPSWLFEFPFPCGVCGNRCGTWWYWVLIIAFSSTFHGRHVESLTILTIQKRNDCTKLETELNFQELSTYHINHRTTVITVSDTDCTKARNNFPFSCILAAARPRRVQANIRPGKETTLHLGSNLTWCLW